MRKTLLRVAGIWIRDGKILLESLKDREEMEDHIEFQWFDFSQLQDLTIVPPDPLITASNSPGNISD